MIIETAGRGGMGTVYRATDRLTGVPVALKVIHQHQEGGTERFLREALVLAQLGHPAVVRYVAHGTTPQGDAFLAMEWLEGQDLSARLQEGPLAIEDALAIASGAAEGLEAAHSLGVIHRDIKPSNLFLVNGEPGSVKVLDFGTARTTRQDQALTASGWMLGTFGYMAPEQVYESRDVDARADVYALGCVLFECLTGRPAFQAQQAIALISKTLLEPPPKVVDLRADVPQALSDLVARMLAKDREQRPASMAAVLAELAHISASQPTTLMPSSRLRPLSGGELRVLTVLLAQLDDPKPSSTAETLASERFVEDMDAVHTIARKHSGEALRLPDGTIIVRLVGGNAGVSDQATRAASCAVELRNVHPNAAVALATGFAETSGRLPLGEVIDRAAGLLSSCPGGTTALDSVTASLVEARFDVGERTHAKVLGEPRLGDDHPRTLLGKPTRTLGRDREISQLLAEFRHCVEERTPCAALVTGAPGAGKSRLRHEFVTRIREDGLARVAMARGESGAAGSAFVMARQIVGKLLGVGTTDTPQTARSIILAQLTGRMPASEAQLTAEFLIQLLDFPPNDDPSPILRSALSDPRLMADWQRRAFEQWLRFEAQAPLVVVLEDMHWADLPTLTYLGSLLKESDVPLMVVGFARPEVHDAFPRLWPGKLHELPLSGLGKRAAAQLVREALGDIDPTKVERLVERAEGNAFYLEELIRAVADGRDATLPETVLAVAHSRVEQLPPAARRLLRAASAFGERFWVSGVAAVIGGNAEVESWLPVLEEKEIVARARTTRFRGELEFAFRHALMKDAVYATLTLEDRVAAHRAAASWLELAGEKDPLLMAEHLERGNEPERAVPWLIRAAEAAYNGGDPVAARISAVRGASKARGEELGQLRMLEGASAGVLGAYADGIAASRDAIALLPRGSSSWLMAISNQQYFGFVSASPTAVSELSAAFADLPPAAVAGGLYAVSLVRIVFTLAQGGRTQEAKTFLERIEASAVAAGEPDPSFLGWRSIARVYFHAFAPGGRVDILVASARSALEKFEALRDGSATPFGYFWYGVALLTVGRHAEAARALAAALKLAHAAGNIVIATQSEMFEPYARAVADRNDDGAEALDRLGQTTNQFFRATALALAGHVRMLRGEHARALESVNWALGRGGPYVDALALAVQAASCVALGRPLAAMEAIEHARACHVQAPLYPTLLAVTQAQALDVLGRRDEARSVLRAARDQILVTADALADPGDRIAWLEKVPANVRTLRLAREWLSSEATPGAK